MQHKNSQNLVTNFTLADFPERPHYLRQPYYAMNQQPWWDDLQTSGAHMSSTYDPSIMRPAPIPQGPSNERLPDSNQSLYTIQSWLSSVIITPFTNFSGRPGRLISVPIRFHADLAALPALSFFIMFDDERSPATLTTPDTPRQRNSSDGYSLTARIPAMNPYRASNTIQLSLAAENNNGDMMFHKELGNYIYMPETGTENQIATPGTSRKRRASDGAPEDELLPISPWKRPRIQPSGNRVIMNHRGQHAQLSTPVLYYPTPMPDQHPHGLRPQPLHRGYLTPDSRFRDMCHSATPFQHDFTPLTRSISHGSYPTFTSLYPSPVATASRSSSQRMNFNSSPSLAAPVSVGAPSMQSLECRKSRWPDSSNLAGQSSIKAKARPNIVITGDLDSMLDDWSEEEVTANRRLVVFEHSQSGSTVSVSFKAVTTEEWSPASACVSCIWWEEKQGGYITSVDTIALAETLCGYRFNVPVKNRIRRNLEGYKPITVAKDKEESEDFFKVVMGFPAPKPRNIEKHIKVFAWRCLGRALKKVIGKYVSQYYGAASASLTVRQGGTGECATRTDAKANNSSNGYMGGQTSDQYLQANFSPGSVSSYEYSMTGSNDQAASRATESPYFDAALPIYLDGGAGGGGGGPIPSDQVPPEYPTDILHTLPPQDALFHGYFDNHYWRQQVESTDEAVVMNNHPWAMASSYDPGLTATPTTGENAYSSVIHSGGASVFPGMLEPTYHGNNHSGQGYHRKTSSM